MSNIEIQETISQLIENQFPRLYREKLGIDPTESDRSVFVDFMEAYYEFLEAEFDENYLRSRKMFEYRDVDTTLDEFLVYFRSKFLKNFPAISTTDERFLIKNILDLYRAKGSPASIKLMIRLLFNEDAVVYFPGKDVLRASDSRWINPVYVEVISSPRSIGYIGKRVFGSISGARAFVEAIVTKRSGNRFIDIIYLSGVEGTFRFGDIITDDGILAGAPKVIGSLSDITIDQNNIGGNSVGDLLDVQAEFGQGAVARVTAVKGQTGGVEFSINDGGYGYTLTNDTQVLISDLVIVTDNSNTIFETDSSVFQALEKIYLNPASSSDLIGAISVGDTIQGLDSTSNAIANAVVLEIGNETLNNIITPYVIVQTENETTFLKTQTLTLTTDTSYLIGRTLEEGSDVTVVLNSSNGSFTNGEVVFQRDFLPNTSNTISSVYIYGEVVTSNSTVLQLTNVFGDIQDDLIITGSSSGATATVESANVTFEGTSGIIDAKLANNQYSVIVEEEFSGTNKIRGRESKVLAEISNTDVTSVVVLEAGSEQANVQSVANVYFTGTVIGQNTINIGIASTSQSDFIFVANVSVINSGNTAFTIEEVTSGSGATFTIGSLTNEETVLLKTERIVDTNIFDVQYKDILVSGKNSGIGFVSSVIVNDGGTGYTNSSVVTFSGGGFLNQSPLIPASGAVITDSNGSITAIDVTNIGEGYFTDASIQVEDGSGANLEVVMTFGYGFPKEILANSNTIISEALTAANVTIGTIATLTGNRPGVNYTGRPFVNVVNPKISALRKQDQIANIDISFGVFIPGEIITQANSAAKGIITSANSTVINVRNISFAEDFTVGGTINGQTTSARAVINNITYDTEARLMGENAIINNFVVEALGVIANVAIVDSGLGYVNGERVTLVRDGISVTGTATVSTQGVAPGYWKTRTSHLSSEKRLQDNDYWQEYSYDIQSPIDLNQYRDIILEVLHISGTRLFGSVVKANEEQVTVQLESTITPNITQ